MGIKGQSLADFQGLIFMMQIVFLKTFLDLLGLITMMMKNFLVLSLVKKIKM